MKKIYIIITLFAAAACVSVCCLCNNRTREKKIITSENITAYLLENGWETDSEMISSEEITIPYEFNETYSHFNDIQKQQGFDLNRFRGENALLITCPVTNYDSENDITAELIVKDTQLIAASLICTGKNGFIKPL